MMIVKEVDPLSSCSFSSTFQIESASCLNCSQPIDGSHVNSYKTHFSSSDDDEEDSLAITLVELLESLYKLKYLKSCPIYSTSIVEDLNLCVCAKCAGPLFKCYELFRQFDLLRAADSFLTNELEKLEDCITKHHNHFQQQQQQREETENIKQEINLDIQNHNYNDDEAPASPIDFNEDPLLNIENNVNSGNSENQNNVDSSSLNLSAGPWILLKRLEDDKIPLNFTTTTKRTSTRRRSKNVERVDDFCEDEDDEDYEPALKRTRVSKSKQPIKFRSTRKINTITNDDDDIKFVDAVKIEEETTSKKSKTSHKTKAKPEKKGSKLKKPNNKSGYKKKMKKPKEKEKKAKNDNSEASISTTTKPSKGRGGRRVASDYPRTIKRKMDYSYMKKKMNYPNPCWYCDEHFSTQSECLTHTKETHLEAEDNLICDQCSRIFKDSNKKSLYGRQKKKDCNRFTPGQILPGFLCPHEPCSKKFPDAQSLKWHVHGCHGSGFTCPHEGCSHKTKQLYTMKSHIRFQHELRDVEKTFECEECHKFLKSPGALTSHRMRFHTEKGYQKYKEKARKILDRQKVERAVVREERLKSYVCTECNVNCFTNFALVYHKKKYHSHLVSNYVCEQCGNGFTQRGSLNQHILYAHTDLAKEFVCDQCGKGFRSNHHLGDHWRRVHTEEGKTKFNAYMRLHQKRRKYRDKQIQAATSNEWADLNIPPELTATANNNNNNIPGETGTQNSNNNTHSISNSSESTQQQLSIEFGLANNV